MIVIDEATIFEVEIRSMLSLLSGSTCPIKIPAFNPVNKLPLLSFLSEIVKLTEPSTDTETKVTPFVFRIKPTPLFSALSDKTRFVKR